MEHDWTKKRIAALLTGDTAALEQWLGDFTAPIYTWLYYCVAGDADLAAEITGRSLSQAIERLSDFDPASERLYLWLKTLTKKMRDEILLHRQCKPQRPWAWSQLPDSVLRSLATLRSEALAEDVANNTCVQELTQATLVEMSHLDRQLMKHRYTHLDTAEHIAEEMGERIEQVNDRLYRCRHFFRRVLIQLVQSENAGFTESNSAGEMELLDSNLEKLLSATAMYQPLSAVHEKSIRDLVLRTAAATAATYTPPRTAARPVLMGAVTGVVVLTVIATLVIILASSRKPVSPPPEPKTVQQTQEPDRPRPDKSGEIDQEQLRRVLTDGQSGNLPGLLEILKNGQFESQFAASHFIGKLGDESAIGLLEEAEQRWYPNGPDDNAFAKAIAQIEARLLADAGQAVEEPEPKPAEPTPPAEPNLPAEPAVEPTPPVGAVAGMVTTADGAPIADARIVLSHNTLTSPTPGRGILSRQRTGEDGRYRFTQQVEGPVFLDCLSDSQQSITTHRAMYCEKNNPLTVDFGLGTTFFGRLTFSGEPAADQILYLSDAMDPDNAAFRGETVTDEFGRFRFPGIVEGPYYLLLNTPENQIIPLKTVEIGGRDMESNVTVESVQLTVEFTLPQEAEVPTITEAVLTYGADVSDDFLRYALTPVEPLRYEAEVPPGTYTLMTTFSNGMQMLEEIELTGNRQIKLEAPEGFATLSGQFTRPSLFALLLKSQDRKLRFELIPAENGLYALGLVPAGVYTLGTVINGLEIDFLQIEIGDEQFRQTLDIDPEQWLNQFSPLYVIVCDAAGNLLTDAQVWLTGGDEVITTRSTGRGAFLAASAGQYSLHAAYPGRGSDEQPVTIQQAPLLSSPNPGNTVLLRIK